MGEKLKESPLTRVSGPPQRGTFGRFSDEDRGTGVDKHFRRIRPGNSIGQVNDHDCVEGTLQRLYRTPVVNFLNASESR